MSNIEKAHGINKIALKKIHNICKKYGITYYLDSGALIGAVRHKSLIPWDDDVDIAFTRAEFEKFLAVPKEEWGQDFEVVPYEQVAPGAFFDMVTRVIYHGETVPTRCYDKAGSKLNKAYADKVAIDCLIMEPAYDSPLKQKILLYRLMGVYGQLMGHREYIDYSEYGFLQRIVIWVLSKIGRLRSLDKLYASYERISRSVPAKSRHMYYTNYPIHLMWVYLEKQWFDSTVQLQIDDEYYDAPVDYDKVLRAQYNNYMELPPKEARVPQHII